MIGIAALLHDDVDYTTKRATMLGFDTRGLNLDFLNELEGNVGVGGASGDILRVLPFDQIGAL